MIEVEVKLALTDSKRVEQKLRKDGFVLQKIVRETDTYFNGVDRDFRKTDEALRVRKTEVLKNVTDLSETDILSEHHISLPDLHIPQNNLLQKMTAKFSRLLPIKVLNLKRHP